MLDWIDKCRKHGSYVVVISFLFNFCLARKSLRETTEAVRVRHLPEKCENCMRVRERERVRKSESERAKEREMRECECVREG